MTYPQSEIANKVNALGSAWEQFKRVNDSRLAELERKGSSDPLYDEQLRKINTALDNTRSQMEHMEAALYRPQAGAEKAVKYSPLAEEHKTAFCAYLRKGADNGLADLENKALSVASDPDGGYLVTSSMSDTLIRLVRDNSPMRRLSRLENISSDALEIIEDRNSATVGWTSETGAVSDTATPQVGKRTIPVHEVYAQPKATQKLIDDSAVDIESWLAEKVADAFSDMENAAFISGDGVGKPRGILTYTAGTSWGEIEQITSDSDGNVTADALVEMIYGMKEGYASRASFLMHRAALQQVRLLKEATTGQYLWQPGIAAGQPDILLGVPVFTSSDMESPATDSLSIALADFQSAYQIVDREGVRILRDPFTDKPFVKFYATKRVGGDVVNFEAIKLMKLGS